MVRLLPLLLTVFLFVGAAFYTVLRAGSIAPEAQLAPSEPASASQEASNTASEIRRQGPEAGEDVTALVRNVTPSWVTNQAPSSEPLERIPGRAIPEAIAAKAGPVTKAGRKTLVIGADRLRMGQAIIALGDVIALPFQAFCPGSNAGKEWPCGRHARSDLRRLIRGKSVSCEPEAPAMAPAEPQAAGHDSSPSSALLALPNQDAHCVVGSVAIGPWLIARGWAVPAAQRWREPTYQNALQKAQRDKTGLWRFNDRAIYCIGSCQFNDPSELSHIAQTDGA